MDIRHQSSGVDVAAKCLKRAWRRHTRRDATFALYYPHGYTVPRCDLGNPRYVNLENLESSIRLVPPCGPQEIPGCCRCSFPELRKARKTSRCAIEQHRVLGTAPSRFKK
jgi:hypothetical protein